MIQRSAPAISLRRAPSMIDACGPVTRLMTFVVPPAKVLVKVALSPTRTLKSLKL